MTRIGQVLLAVRRKDVAEIEELYADFERNGLCTILGWEDNRLLGILAHATGKFDDAAGHFEEALAFCRRVGYRPQLAWACSEYAEMLLDRDDPSPSGEGSGISDREKAVELQDEALAITRELGMRPLTERILARREILRA